MNICEFGQENRECVLFLHASCTSWDFYEESIQRLSAQYHVMAPAMPGHDLTTDEDYTSVEEIAAELEQWLLTRFIAVRDFFDGGVGQAQPEAAGAGLSAGEIRRGGAGLYGAGYEAYVRQNHLAGV